ncbi:lipoyl synthase [bacterium]|nr:lipoyl synthase [candidate division CSSED10-310 bacterium]
MRGKRLPDWFKVPLGSGEHYREVRRTLAAQGLHTVCSEAHCPNLGECWSCGTATFMILGDRCSRNCRFCAVQSGNPEPPDPTEPRRVRVAVETLGLHYVVVTSVTRDDLPDGGASMFAAVIREIKSIGSGIRVEVLIPDFAGDQAALDCVLDASPEVLNHNIETVPGLYSRVRPEANYHQSLAVLRSASNRLGEHRTKSGLMVGMGETWDELMSVFTDLRAAGVGRLTIGQYLQPSAHHVPVVRYLEPVEFESLGEEARRMGFTHVASGPLVRSSYHAAEMSSESE